MAVKVGELYGELSLHKDPFTRGLDAAEQHAKGWGSRVGNILSGVGTALLKWGTLAAGAGAAGSFLLAGFASDAEEARSKVSVVFGDWSEDIQHFAETGAQAMGLSETAVLSAAGTYGNLFDAMGIGAEANVEMSTGLVQLASDLASFNNMDPTEVLDKLRAGLVGEVEPLRSVGVNLNQARIEAKALELGLWDGEGALDASAKAQASYALILEDTTNAQGDFARTSEGMANQQRILKATFEDAMAKIGEAFMPIFQAILPQLTAALSGLAEWVTANLPAIQSTFETVFGIIGEVFGALQGAVEQVWPIVQSAFDWLTDNGTNLTPILAAIAAVIMAAVVPAIISMVAAMAPVIVVVGAIAGGVALLMKAFDENWLGIRDIVENVAGFLMPIFETVGKFLSEHLPGALRTFGRIAGQVFEMVWNVVGGYIELLIGIWTTAFDIAGKVADGIGDAWNGLVGVLRTVWSTISGIFRTGVNVLVGIVNGIIGAINAVQVHIPRIGLDTPAGFVGVGPFDWWGLRLKTLPYLQTGARNFRGGLAVVGERGPELVNLPRGADVFSAEDTRKIGANRPLIGEQTIIGLMPDEVERQVLRAHRRIALEWTLEGGR